MPHMDMPMDYHMWDANAMLEYCQRHMPKLVNIMPSSKAVLSMI